MAKHAHHLKKLAEADPHFKALVGKFGMPRATKDCSEMNPGDPCMVTDCVDGKRIVMKCDGSGGCTRYSVEECQSGG